MKLPRQWAPPLFGFILSGLMSLLVSGIATVRAVGFVPALPGAWAGAWLSSWPVAFPVVPFLTSVFRAEQCSFSSISNVRVDVRGTQASGADYFVHLGYNDPKYGVNTRHLVEGQHFYEFVREKGEWRISRMLGRPTFETVESFPPAAMKHCP